MLFGRKEPRQIPSAKRFQNSGKRRTDYSYEDRTDDNKAATFQKVLEIAKNEKLSFYDSSCICFAKEKDPKLIIQDKQLKAKAQK